MNKYTRIKSILDYARGKTLVDVEPLALSDDASIAVKASFDAKAEVETDKGKRDLIIIATTDDIDEEGEVVVQHGIDRSYMERNRRIFAEHDTSLQSTVGTMRVMYPRPGAIPSEETKRWFMRIYVARTPLGDDVLTLAREVGIGASIGFEVLESGKPTAQELKRYSTATREPEVILRKTRLIETSLVAAPCNVNCQVVDVDKKMAAIDELLTKGYVRSSS